MNEIAYAYIRVSQEDENPENQWFAIKTFCEQNNLVCIKWEEPKGTSGAIDPFERPVFSQMWKSMLDNGIRKLIVVDIDRITRDAEHWKKFFRLAAEHGIEIVSLADKDLVDALNKVVEQIKELKERVSDKAVVREFIEYQIEQVERFIDMYFRMRAAAAEDYRRSVVEKTKTALQRLKAEGKVYHRPTIVHYLALLITGKKEPRELTREDIEQAREIFCKFVNEIASKPLEGSLKEAWREFATRYRLLYERFPKASRSYVAFLNTYKKMCRER